MNPTDNEFVESKSEQYLNLLDEHDLVDNIGGERAAEFVRVRLRQVELFPERAQAALYAAYP